MNSEVDEGKRLTTKATRHLDATLVAHSDLNRRIVHYFTRGDHDRYEIGCALWRDGSHDALGVVDVGTS